MIKHASFSEGYPSKAYPSALALAISFLFGLTCFSGLLSIFQLDVLGLPFLIFEPIVFLFWMWAVKPRTITDFTRFSRAKIAVLIFAYVVLFFLALIAALEYDLRSVFSSARAYFLAVIMLVFGRILGNLSDRELFFFFFGIVTGDLFSTYLNRFDLNQDVVATPVNLIGLYVFTSLAVQSRKISLIILAIVTATALTFLSALRIVALTSVFSLAVTLLIIFTHRGGLKNIAPILISFTAMYFVLNVVLDWYVEHGADVFGNKAFYRIYFRLGAYFEGGGVNAAQDVGRFSQLRMLLLDDGLPVLPQGFVMTARNMIGQFNDAPFLYFTYTFGLIVGVMLLGLLVFVSLRMLIRSIGRSLSACEIVSVALVPYFLTVLLFLSGRYMYIPYETVLFWSFVTFWFRGSVSHSLRYAKWTRKTA